MGGSASGGGAGRARRARAEGRWEGGRACLPVHLQLDTQHSPWQGFRGEQDKREPRSGLVHNIIHNKGNAVADQARSSDDAGDCQTILHGVVALELLRHKAEVDGGDNQHHRQEQRDAANDGLVHDAQHVGPVVLAHIRDNGAVATVNGVHRCAVGRLEQHNNNDEQGGEQQRHDHERDPHEQVAVQALAVVAKQDVRHHKHQDDKHADVEERGDLHQDDLGNSLIGNIKHFHGQKDKVDCANDAGSKQEDHHGDVVQDGEPPQGQNKLSKLQQSHQEEDNGHDDEDGQLPVLQRGAVRLVLPLVDALDRGKEAIVEVIKTSNLTTDVASLFCQLEAKWLQLVLRAGEVSGKVVRVVVLVAPQGVFQGEARLHVLDPPQVFASDADGISYELAHNSVVLVDHHLQPL
mmetsp:Transcript_17632/g.44927  ORF Transcript_17632/g.44927 Transcript_17632/m.44927 type:complete len:407 (-) Transcript_17632:4374-5594(-)